MFYRIVVSTLLIYLFITVPFCNVFSQNKGIEDVNGVTGNPAAAADFILNGDYKNALKEYLVLLKTYPDNIEYNLGAIECYININTDKSKAFVYLDRLLRQKNIKPITYFYLGQIYHLNYVFDEAIEAFTTFKRLAKKETERESFKNLLITPEELVEQADRYIKVCNNAIELMKAPVKVTFKNAGENVNSEYHDYTPFIAEDESFMVFSTRRQDVLGAVLDVDGYSTADVFYSTVKDGQWTKAKNVGINVNTEFDEQATGLTPDGRTLMVFMNNGKKILGDLYMSKKNENEVFQQSEPIKDINTKWFEWAASITTDGEEIFYAGESMESLGGTDIFSTKKLPNGKWGTPVSVGKSVNSKYDESYPTISADGKTLYFCSKGHNTMGGFDLFKSDWDETKKKWLPPVNLGYPINTPNDDLTISITKNERYGYISTYRQGSYGDVDIYQITFNNVEAPKTVVKGVITSDIKGSLKAAITVTNLETSAIVGHYAANEQTGKYILILPEGKYTITVTATGCKPYSGFVEILGKSSYQAEMVKHILLERK